MALKTSVKINEKGEKMILASSSDDEILQQRLERLILKRELEKQKQKQIRIPYRPDKHYNKRL